MQALPAPQEVDVGWEAAYRIIPSHYPPINVFETLYDSADELEIAFALESLTNDRLVAQAGNFSAVRREDWVTGPGATALMAAFTHVGYPSRFTDGSFGIYYAADTEATAIAESAHHKSRFLAATKEPDMELTMRVYKNMIVKPLLDLRADAFAPLCDPESYVASQQFGKQQNAAGCWGLLYASVRHAGGECAAILRPPAISLPTQTRHLRYVWSGEQQRFTDFFEIRGLTL